MKGMAILINIAEEFSFNWHYIDGDGWNSIRRVYPTYACYQLLSRSLGRPQNTLMLLRNAAVRTAAALTHIE